jgi:hypothetical protein
MRSAGALHVAIVSSLSMPVLGAPVFLIVLVVAVACWVVTGKEPAVASLRGSLKVLVDSFMPEREAS